MGDDGRAVWVGCVQVDGAARQRLLHRVGHEAGAREGELDGRDIGLRELLDEDVALGGEALEEGGVGVDGGEVGAGDLGGQVGEEGGHGGGDGREGEEGDAVALGAGVGARFVGDVGGEGFGVEGGVGGEGAGVGEGLVHWGGVVSGWFAWVG